MTILMYYIICFMIGYSHKRLMAKLPRCSRHFLRNSTSLSNQHHTQLPSSLINSSKPTCIHFLLHPKQTSTLARVFNLYWNRRKIFIYGPFWRKKGRERLGFTRYMGERRTQQPYTWLNSPLGIQSNKVNQPSILVWIYATLSFTQRRI